MIKVAIIEDNDFMREGWKAVLDLDPGIVVTETYRSCEMAFADPAFPVNDLVLLDIELPGIHGTEGVKIIKENYPDILVLMVTIHEENEKIFTALRNGAVGYLLKKTSPDDLIAAIKDAKEGGAPMSPIIARKVISSFHKTEKKDYELSEQEESVLSALAEGLSYKATADKHFLSIDGVRYHIRNIYQKLEAKNRAEAIAKGYRFNLIKHDS